MKPHPLLPARIPCLVLAAMFAVPGPAAADITIPYNEYSASPTLGRGAGTSTDPTHPGYGALRFFIDRVADLTDDQGPDALPPGQKVVFRRDAATGRELNALRAGIQLARRGATPAVVEPSWGFIYNSVPFGMRFEQMLGFLYDANGLALAQSLLDVRGGTQVVLPVVGSTMQGSGYFPQPVGAPDCPPGDAECASHGQGIGLAGSAAQAGGSATCRPPRTSSTARATSSCGAATSRRRP